MLRTGFIKREGVLMEAFGKRPAWRGHLQRSSDLRDFEVDLIEQLRKRGALGKPNPPAARLERRQFSPAGINHAWQQS